MVTKIVNNTDKDVVFYTVNVRNYTETDKGNVYPPVERVVKAGETLYSRSVTGDTAVEDYLTKAGCTLTRIYRNLWLIIAGQSNAVGYDETPWDADDVGAIPYCYFEGMKTHGGYGNADCVPAINAGIDSFQDMQNVGGVGTRTKSLAYPLAKELIGMIPDGYELLISNYSQGMSYLLAGNVGTLNSSNLPENSTRWNSDGNLTKAMGRRMNLQLGRIQANSKLLGVIWCQGEADGQANKTPADYAAAFKATIDEINNSFIGNANFGNKTNIYSREKIYFNQFQINTQEAHDQNSSPLNEAAFVEFGGGTFVATAKNNWAYIDHSEWNRDTYFRTNLNPLQVEVAYGSAAPTQNADTQEWTILNDRADVCEVSFFTGRRVGYRVIGDISRDKMPIYVAFKNKINGKYMGYVVLNWSSSGAVTSNPFTYAEANAKVEFKHPLWIVFPGPQKYWDTQGTFSQLMAWQKENFTGFIDLPKDLATNDANATGTKANAWNGWKGYGFTSSTKPSHYGQNVFRYIAKLIVAKIAEMNVRYNADNAI